VGASAATGAPALKPLQRRKMARNSVEKNRAYYKNYYAGHKEELKANQARYEEKNPRIHVPDSSREVRLKYHYKMTVEEYEKKLAEQGGHCALCSKTQGDEKRRMAVDHDHSCCEGHKACGKCNRGILCSNCNRKLGFLEEILTQVETIVPSPGTWLEKALGYLRKWQKIHSKTQETQ
jgi:hypothetical protein